jgi:hypothetical protein
MQEVEFSNAGCPIRAAPQTGRADLLTTTDETPTERHRSCAAGIGRVQPATTERVLRSLALPVAHALAPWAWLSDQLTSSWLLRTRSICARPRSCVASIFAAASARTQRP